MQPFTDRSESALKLKYGIKSHKRHICNYPKIYFSKNVFIHTKASALRCSGKQLFSKFGQKPGKVNVKVKDFTF